MLFEEGAEMQRGRNVLPVVLESLRRLNSLGYGRDSSCLELDLMCNPPGASLPPPRASFEKRYRDHLGQKHGITFNALYTLNNMLLGRLRESLSAQESDSYVELLAKNFNADNVENLLCRSCVTFGPNSANCYDCDFKRVLDLPVTAGTRTVTIHEFDRDTLGNRAIETSNLCFGCTAKAGLECCADKL
jgi:radical SAM/Cys-rich protein